MELRVKSLRLAARYSPFQKVFRQPGNPIIQVTLKMRMIEDSTSESAATSSVNLVLKSK